MIARLALASLTAAAVLALASGCQVDFHPAGDAPTSRLTGKPTSASESPAPPLTSSGTCRLSQQLVPSCGVLWGVSANPATYQNLLDLEQQVGRRFDLVYHYHDIVGAIPDDAERAEVGAGQILHVAVAARIYAAGQHDPVTYAGIAAGTYDATLRRQAAGIAALKVPVFVTFEQEASQHRKLGVRGTAAQFRQAWRHVHQVYVDAGATNAVWVWVMTGDPSNFARAATLWPGNDVVDWISWNVYNQAGCQSGAVKPTEYASFADRLMPFYQWVHQHGPSIGMDPTKPMMISEAGSVRYPGDPQKTAGWYAQIPTVLKRVPQVKAIALWDSQTSSACDYRFQLDPAVLQAVAAAGHDPYLGG